MTANRRGAPLVTPLPAQVTFCGRSWRTTLPAPPWVAVVQFGKNDHAYGEYCWYQPNDMYGEPMFTTCCCDSACPYGWENAETSANAFCESATVSASALACD